MSRRAEWTLVVLAVAVLSGVGHGQGSAGTPPRGGVVSGTVIDSLSGRGLAGALVQIVADSTGAIPRTVLADSAGRYRIEDVARGRYLVGFLHPMLDSLTLEPIIKQIDVADAPVRLDLAIPSPQRLRGVFCGPRTAANAGAAFVGVVRDAGDARPVAGASIVADWVDMIIARGGITSRPSRLSTVSTANGWFALCGVPGPGVITIHALRGADTTDLIDVAMPEGGFARRDLYVAASRSDGRLSGRVVNDRGAPINSAIVNVTGGSRTRSTADGQWSLESLRPGTRVLEVRAIGFFPIRRSVDVVADAPPLRVEMTTFEAVLDTLRITASGIRGADEGGFEQRRRSQGFGRFLTEDDIRRKAPTETSDIFKSVPGMYTGFRMRDAFGTVGGGCTPNVFIDGHPMPQPDTVDELDSWVRPSDISSIEIYPDVPPPQFQVALSGCGSVVIWTKRRPAIRKPPV